MTVIIAGTVRVAVSPRGDGPGSTASSTATNDPDVSNSEMRRSVAVVDSSETAS